MINNMKYLIALSLLTAISLLGCTTWHQNLMSNDQLVAANCEQLANESKMVADNAQHLTETSRGGAVGTVFLAVLEGMAASASDKPLDTKASQESAKQNEEHAKQASELESRKGMVEMLRSKKGCS